MADLPRVDPALMADVWRHLRNRGNLPRPALPEGRGQIRVENASSDTAEMYIYDEIGMWGVWAEDVIRELLAINARNILLHLNTPGGDVFDGVAIYNALRDHPANVTVSVDALAASAGSFIAMAGDTVRMNRASQLMIHDASGLCIGNAADMGTMGALLDRVSDTIAGIYADRAGGDTAEWRDLMRAETWYSAAEAVEAKLADEMAGKDEDEKPTASFDLKLTSFMYAGRAQAPAPPRPGEVPQVPVADRAPAFSQFLAQLTGGGPQ